MRRLILGTIGAVGALALFGAQLSHAQTFPNKPIKFVVPYPPGGSPDVLARSLGQKISESIGQQVIVDNRPGGGGLIAANIVAGSPADGYTLLVADSSVYSITPNLNKKANFEPLKVLAPISLAATSPIYLVANADIKVSNVKELLAYAKQNPGMPYGSSGNGTAHHLSMELFKSLSGVDMMHIPYKGAAQTVPALLAGDVGIAFTGLNVAATHAKAGKLKILAIAEGKRSALSPEVPTIAESGVPGFDVSITLGVFAPANTPRSIIDRINAEVGKALKAPDVQQRLHTLGVEGVGSTPERFTETIRKELVSYQKLVKDTGAQLD
jgi:tripartite-type tricarboxylate transporter receptor subunit TctC